MSIAKLFKRIILPELIAALILTGVCHAQSADDLKPEEYHPTAAVYIVPLAFISYGLISLTGRDPIRSLDLTTKNELQEDHPLFAAHADNFLQYAPAAAVLALQLRGIKGKNQMGDAAGRYLMSMAIMTGTVTTLKYITKRERPDHSVFNSFPSGHTATVFASAEFLKQEYREHYPWLGYTGYVVATATGALRMYNNRHWFSDVVAGAGFGILSTKLSYMLYPHVRKTITLGHKSAFTLVPTYQEGKAGFYLTGNF